MSELRGSGCERQDVCVRVSSNDDKQTNKPKIFCFNDPNTANRKWWNTNKDQDHGEFGGFCCIVV